MKKSKQITVPTKSADITLGDFQKVMALDDSGVSKAIAVLSNLSEDEVKAMKESDVQKVYSLCMDALLDKNQPTQLTWKHKGIKYALHPNFASMTLGEITDLETYMNREQDLHKAMAVCYREIIKETEVLEGMFSIVPYEGTAKTGDIFKEIPLSYYYGLRSFFLTTGQELNVISRNFSTPPGTQKI